MRILNNISEIEVATYLKGNFIGIIGGKMCDMEVLTMDGDNLTCKIGCDVEQTITKLEALKYINSNGGFI